ncbi:MAG: PIN domain-containing protein [Hyphomonadaceae bacterium]|nr:PIN domain-containing protein [Hyphomonadaceae bacterium]
MIGVRVSLDSNVLVYAALEPASIKGVRARELIQLATPNLVLAMQALLEFVAVLRRRAPALTSKAIAQAEAWAEAFEVAPTTPEVAKAAYALVARHNFQVWDAVIWSAARMAGARVFFSEDLQNGMVLDGVGVVDPFAASEAELRAALGV